MKAFKNAIADVRNTLNNLIIFDTSINTILLFLILLLVLSIFNLPLIYPVTISLIYFVYVLRKKLKLSKIKLVEQKYQNLDEKLRTAAEHSTEENPVVKELHSEVLHDLRQVEESTFLNERKIYMKSIGIVALAFLILLLSPVTFGVLNFNFNLVDQESQEAEEGPGTGGSGSSKIRFAVGSQDTGLKKTSDDIYGKPTVVKLGDDEIKIRIRPAGTELSIREIQEADFPDFSESYPSEIQAVAAESFEEEIAKEDLKLVKNYFNTLAGS
ncbi:hypothetical protein CMO88_02965 [Candidatus Woesearchaeota archaeon]|nr:hypothetical protein [Candidatus Woesearchaeota archaeon]|tara:strand:- start:15504 stop:16313 length:810 start_codon:yes stop_codon:yes gene_type:complete